MRIGSCILLAILMCGGCTPFYKVVLGCYWNRNSYQETVSYSLEGLPYKGKAVKGAERAFEALKAASDILGKPTTTPGGYPVSDQFGGWWPDTVTRTDMNGPHPSMQIGSDTAAGYKINAVADIKTHTMKVEVSVLHMYCAEGDPKPAAKMLIQKLKESPFIH